MEITYCPNCGHQNQPGSRFCEECGCDLIQAAAQQEAQMAETSAGATGSTGTAKSTGSQTEYGSTNIFQ